MFYRDANGDARAGLAGNSIVKTFGPGGIFALWRATGRMGYHPAGAVYRTLLLTGLRLNEAAQISWSEVQGDTIVIPASRMKGKEQPALF